MLDLAGPSIKLGEFTGRVQVPLKAGQEFRIVSKKKILGDETFAVCENFDLGSKVKIGDHIVVDFGNICLKVIGYEEESEFFLRKQEGKDLEMKAQDKSKRENLSFQGNIMRGGNHKK